VIKPLCRLVDDVAGSNTVIRSASLPQPVRTIVDATCRNVKLVTGRHTSLNVLSSRSCEGGIHIDGITLMISVFSKLIASD